jgi:hypothetical protein
MRLTSTTSQPHVIEPACSGVYLLRATLLHAVNHCDAKAWANMFNGVD